MQKDNKQLLQEFKMLETKLLDVLKVEPVEVDDNISGTMLKKRIKKYISKVSEARKIFEQYEEVAKQIEKAAAKDKTVPPISEAIVDLREVGENVVSNESVALGYGFENELKTETEDKFENETLIVDEKHVVVKKKKTIQKEM